MNIFQKIKREMKWIGFAIFFKRKVNELDKDRSVTLADELENQVTKTPKNIAIHFFTNEEILDKCPESCHTCGALEKRYVGVREKSGELYRYKIPCRFHFSHQILSPLAFCLPLKHLKIKKISNDRFLIIANNFPSLKLP